MNQYIYEIFKVRFDFAWFTVVQCSPLITLCLGVKSESCVKGQFYKGFIGK